AEDGIRVDLVTGVQTCALPILLDASAITTAWFNPLSGRVNPADLTAAYAKGARSRGAMIMENRTATGLSLSNGRIVAVETDSGRSEERRVGKESEARREPDSAK